ncbi:hypothetical protein NITMOv2_1635 [Nitrospira moscoviensis]|uniref:Uncharacterized protein n=1 Tax=Nitrospira moscoviensis TaxID=42253 RepID=A0A0K2GB16_NITMO|nr:hypothetical protein NITMOv2_1635 [Nitrospira moscoviensis]
MDSCYLAALHYYLCGLMTQDLRLETVHVEGALDKFAWYRYRLSESAVTLIHAHRLCRSKIPGLR